MRMCSIALIPFSVSSQRPSGNSCTSSCSFIVVESTELTLFTKFAALVRTPAVFSASAIGALNIAPESCRRSRIAQRTLMVAYLRCGGREENDGRDGAEELRLLTVVMLALIS